MRQQTLWYKESKKKRESATSRPSLTLRTTNVLSHCYRQCQLKFDKSYSWPRSERLKKLWRSSRMRKGPDQTQKVVQQLVRPKQRATPCPPTSETTEQSNLVYPLPTLANQMTPTLVTGATSKVTGQELVNSKTSNVQHVEDSVIQVQSAEPDTGTRNPPKQQPCLATHTM